MGNLSFRGWNRNPFLGLSIDCEQKTTDHLDRRRLDRPAAAVLAIEEEGINDMGDNLSVTRGMSFPINILLVSTGAFGCLVIQCKVHEAFPKPNSCFQIGHAFIFPLCRYLARLSFAVTAYVWFFNCDAYLDHPNWNSTNVCGLNEWTLDHSNQL